MGLKIPAGPRRGRSPTPAHPLPPAIPAPRHALQAYLLPELPSHAQSRAVTAATAPRSRGDASQSPGLAPGGRRHRQGGARAAPRNRPSAGEGRRRRVSSGTRQPLRQGQARLGRGQKSNKERTGSETGPQKHRPPLGRMSSKRRRKSRACPGPLGPWAASGR